MSPGLWQILAIAVLILLLFGGRGKISSIMGDVARGIRSFRKGLKDEETNEQANPSSLENENTIDITPAQEQRSKDKSNKE